MYVSFTKVPFDAKKYFFNYSSVAFQNFSFVDEHLFSFALGSRWESSKDIFVPTKECTIHYHTKPNPYALQPFSPCETAVRYYFEEGWLTLKLYHVKLNFVFVPLICEVPI